MTDGQLVYRKTYSRLRVCEIEFIYDFFVLNFFLVQVLPCAHFAYILIFTTYTESDVRANTLPILPTLN